MPYNVAKHYHFSRLYNGGKAYQQAEDDVKRHPVVTAFYRHNYHGYTGTCPNMEAAVAMCMALNALAVGQLHYRISCKGESRPIWIVEDRYFKGKMRHTGCTIHYADTQVNLQLFNQNMDRLPKRRVA